MRLVRGWTLLFIVACGGQTVPKDNVATTPSSVSSSSSAPSPIASAPSRLNVAPSATPTQISAGGEVTCARMSDATVRCWGKNEFGQVGEGASDTQTKPRTVPGLTGVTRISVGDAFACALMDDATVRCWGSNYYGALGLGDEAARTTPTPVPGLRDVAQIATGWATCALLRNGHVSCWGDWVPGVGDPRTIGSKSPLEVIGIGDAVEVAVGRSHSCARRASGVVTCWRHISPGLVPRGKTRADPVTVRITDATNLSLGSSGAATTKTGEVKCWATNCAFELGRDASADYSAAFVVPKTSHAVEVAISDDVACYRRDDGNVMCQEKSGIVPVPNVSRATMITAGASHACALVPSGVMCWRDHAAPVAVAF